MKLMANDYSTIHNIGQKLKSAGKNFAMAATIGVCAYGVLEGAYRAENAVKYFDYKNSDCVEYMIKAKDAKEELHKPFLIKQWYEKIKDKFSDN
ncbi:MAG: hypothetical protein MJ237_07785 [bacterium]|nr:hypothetical protein [bacterium]